MLHPLGVVLLEAQLVSKGTQLFHVKTVVAVSIASPEYFANEIDPRPQYDWRRGRHPGRGGPLGLHLGLSCNSLVSSMVPKIHSMALLVVGDGLLCLPGLGSRPGLLCRPFLGLLCLFGIVPVVPGAFCQSYPL